MSLKLTPLQAILNGLADSVKVGMTGQQLEEMAIALIRLNGLEPAFPGYKPKDFKGKDGYPATICVSVNGDVIHGIPTDRKFETGDVVSIDTGIKKNDQFDDGAITVLVGERDPNDPEKVFGCSSAARRLVKATKEALDAGCAAAVAGKTTHDIARAISAVAQKYDVNVIEGYGGHGIGEELHMEPHVPNVVPVKVMAASPEGEPTESWPAGSEPVELKPSMRLALEPMFTTAKTGRVFVDKNGWTVKLVGGGLAAHFERTVTVA